jgi:hypothetical protein
LEISSHAREIYNNGDAEVLEVGFRTNTGEQEKLRTIEGAS